MRPYPKIQTLFQRDPDTKYKTVLLGQYALPEFEYLARNDWECTEKVDGTNIRVMIQEGGVTFGGKTDNAQIPAKLLNHLKTLFADEDKLHRQFPEGGCLYGEGYGAGIQKVGGLYSPIQKFVLFDVLVGEWWLERPVVEHVAAALEIDVVPSWGLANLHEIVDMVKTVSDPLASFWGKFPAEGIVARPAVSLLRRNGQRIITKLKRKDFPQGEA